MTNNLPTGVWKDDENTLYCCNGGGCFGTGCAACREYRRPDNTSVQQDGTQPPPDGYYCGKAGRP